MTRITMIWKEDLHKSKVIRVFRKTTWIWRSISRWKTKNRMRLTLTVATRRQVMSIKSPIKGRSCCNSSSSSRSSKKQLILFKSKTPPTMTKKFIYKLTTQSDKFINRNKRIQELRLDKWWTLATMNRWFTHLRIELRLKVWPCRTFSSLTTVS